MEGKRAAESCSIFSQLLLNLGKRGHHHSHHASCTDMHIISNAQAHNNPMLAATTSQTPRHCSYGWLGVIATFSEVFPIH